VGLGNVNGRRFLFHVGVGFDAAVVSMVEKRSALKRYLGHAYFAYCALRTWGFGYDRRHPHFAVVLETSDGSRVTVEDGYFAIMMNSNPYTFVGERPFNLAPGTDMETPLTAVVLRSLGAPTVLGMAIGALRTPSDGTPPHHRRTTVVPGVVAATLTARDRVPYQMDGEPLGEAGELEFRWEPDSLRLVRPARPPG
jgi:diacylglycerol kinase family enzyme